MAEQRTEKPKQSGSGVTGVMRKHYVTLFYRSALFLAFLIAYIRNLLKGEGRLLSELEERPLILVLIWCVFAAEMLLRFFPSRWESPGCQKQFARNYIRTGKTEIIIPDNYGVMLAAMVWIIPNCIIGALHMSGFLDDDFMLLLCCAYSVCDMICILFFCPFQSWILKNKCCSACRIYNWDYPMMFTPLFFVHRWYSRSLLALAVGLLLRWEITFFRHPERFSENTNDYLKCANCTEKLCRHKKQLKGLWKRIDAFTKERARRLGD